MIRFHTRRSATLAALWAAAVFLTAACSSSDGDPVAGDVTADVVGHDATAELDSGAVADVASEDSLVPDTALDTMVDVGVDAGIDAGIDVPPSLDLVQEDDIVELVDVAETPEDAVETPEDVIETVDVPEPPEDVVETPEDVVETPEDVVETPEDMVETPDVASDVPETPPAGPFGAIEGSCFGLVDEINSAAPSVWINTYVFDGDPFDAADLDPDALEIFEVPNAGGSSKCSEVFSMEVMDDCLGADLHKTETEVSYDAEGSITDYVILVGDDRVGVSVTRAYRGPFVSEYSLEDATGLLTDKLEGVNESSANVSAEDVWVKQILHVWTLHADWADLVAEAWETLDPAIKADTIVLVTVETGSEFVVTDTCDD